MNTDKSKSIINFLEHNAIWKCNIPLLSSTNAITLIDLCKFENKKILGIDTFRIIENAIQPLLDESIDYSISKKKSNTWEDAKAFITLKNDKKYYYEIVYDE